MPAHWRGQFVKQTHISTQTESWEGDGRRELWISVKVKGHLPLLSPPLYFLFWLSLLSLESHLWSEPVAQATNSHTCCCCCCRCCCYFSRSPSSFFPPLVPLPRMPYTAYWCVRGSPYMKLLPQWLPQRYAMLPMLSNIKTEKHRERKRERLCTWLVSTTSISCLLLKTAIHSFACHETVIVRVPVLNCVALPGLPPFKLSSP